MSKFWDQVAVLVVVVSKFISRYSIDLNSHKSVVIPVVIPVDADCVTKILAMEYVLPRSNLYILHMPSIPEKLLRVHLAMYAKTGDLMVVIL